jgi:hypothetical protein
MSFPSTLHSISDFCGYSPTIISMVFNAVVNHVSDFMADRIHFDRNYLTKDSILRCANAIHEKGSPLIGCWGFIDGTVRPVSRPVVGQEGIYNGHHRTHALKYQGVTSADGMIVSLAGPFFGRDHDMRMLNESNLLALLENLDYIDNRDFYIYGDSGYVMSRFIQIPFEGLNLNPAKRE